MAEIPDSLRRSVVLDLEATGLFISQGHRIVEIGIVELVDGKPSGRTYHAYVNPQRDVPEEVVAIHGLTAEFLADKPVFADIAAAAREFIGGSEIIITCREEEGYALDIDMLTMEMEAAGFEAPDIGQWTNVRRWSEKMYGYEGARLNNVARRFGVDTGDRESGAGHGALKDAQLLAAVYPHLYKAWKEFQQSVKE